MPNNMNILILEDDISVASNLSKRLITISDNINIKPKICTNIDEAISSLKNTSFDACIIDLMLNNALHFNDSDDETGLKLLNEIRSHNKTAKIVAYSGYREQTNSLEIREKIDNFDFTLLKSESENYFTNYFKDIFNDFIAKKNVSETKHKSKIISSVRSSIKVVNRSLVDIYRNDPELLRAMNPIQFEHLIAELFENQGYEVLLTPPRADGGKDLYVYKSDPILKTSFLVECKRYVPPNKVGVEIARQLYGVVKHEDVNGGIIVTTSYFTRGAKQFADTVPYQLFLRDFEDLKSWLETKSISTQN